MLRQRNLMKVIKPPACNFILSENRRRFLQTKIRPNVNNEIIIGHTVNFVSPIIAVKRNIVLCIANNGVFSKRTEMNLYLIFYLKFFIVLKKNQKWYILKYNYTMFGLF